MRIFFAVTPIVFVSANALAYPTVFPTETTIDASEEACSSYRLVSDHADQGKHASVCCAV